MGSASKPGSSCPFATIATEGPLASLNRPPESATAVPLGTRQRRTPDRSVTAAPRSGNAPPLRPNPGGRTLKSFTPSAEYNLERLTPEQMAEWLAELKREQGG